MKHILGPNSKSLLTGVQEGDSQPNAVDLRLDKVFRITSNLFELSNEHKDHRGSDILNTDDENYAVNIDEYYLITDEESMISHIFSTGPISICVDASTWSSYVSGIITTCGMEVDHCVQVVGLSKDEGYWIVRNSWGTEWGIDGYIWLEAGINMCNIAYDPKYVNAVVTCAIVGFGVIRVSLISRKIPFGFMIIPFPTHCLMNS
jgi:hypothetical protein